MIITQHYNKLNKEQVPMMYLKKKHVFYTKLDIIDKQKSVQAIVPNLIHSFDSTYLNKIITNFRLNNILLLPIHDCFIIEANDYLFLKKNVIDQYIL